jgi:hypothetical protein
LPYRYQKRFSAADIDVKPAPPPVVRPPVIEPSVSAQSIEPIEEALPVLFVAIFYFLEKATKKC